ncbi:MAG: acyl carrier protein [Opitutales bacterium]
MDQDIRERLEGYPGPFQQKVMAWRAKPESALAPELAEGILRFHIGEGITQKLKAKGDDSLLVEDLGLDSLTMVEIAFEAEEFLGLSLNDDELRAIRSFGDLRNFIEERAQELSKEKRASGDE